MLMIPTFMSSKLESTTLSYKLHAQDACTGADVGEKAESAEIGLVYPFVVPPLPMKKLIYFHFRFTNFLGMKS